MSILNSVWRKIVNWQNTVCYSILQYIAHYTPSNNFDVRNDVIECLWPPKSEWLYNQTHVVNNYKNCPKSQARSVSILSNNCIVAGYFRSGRYAKNLSTFWFRIFICLNAAVLQKLIEYRKRPSLDKNNVICLHHTTTRFHCSVERNEREGMHWIYYLPTANSGSKY